MMLTLLTILFILSLAFMLMKHPLSAGLILILSTILTAFNTAYMLQTFWFSYIMTLIFVGGMLILFIYMISLSPNQKFSFSPLLLIISFFIVLTSLINLIDPMTFSEISQTINNLFSSNLPKSIKLFNSNTSIITIVAVNYLFLIMIIVTKITSSIQGPMRSNF